MRVLKNRVVPRAFAAFFLVIILQSTFLPHYAYALTTGPHQPEYTSYEEPGTPDMVNLLTGDFTYNTPLLDIPGPEGGFSVPLTYHAGIGLEQEASWVGLGWTINVGSITRTYTGFPDDSNGETQSITVKDLTGVKGWTSSLLGLGNIGWNSEVGHYGQISLLGLSWDGEGASVNPVQLGLTILSIITVAGAVGTLASTTATASQVASATSNLAMEAMNLTMTGIMNGVSASQTPIAPTSGHWKYTKREKQKWFHKEYKIWLDQTRYEDMYGVLYLQNAVDGPYPNFSSDQFKDMNLHLNVNSTPKILNAFSNADYKGSASDINHYLPASTSFERVKTPATLAMDDYKVNSPGISGSIIPYRFDLGSVSVPRSMANSHVRLSPLKFSNYKVPFIYESSIGNNYFHHVGGASSITSPSFYFGITTTLQNSSTEGKQQTYNLTDVIFDESNRLRSDIAGQKKIPMANHIEWISNNEIATTNGGFLSGFMDYFPPSARTLFRNSQSFAGNKVCITTSSNFTSSGVITVAASDIKYFVKDAPVSISLDVWANGRPIDDEVGDFNPTRYSYQTTVTAVDPVGNKITLNVTNFNNIIFGKPVDFSITTNSETKSPTAIGGYSITNASGLTYHFALPVYDYDQFTRIEQLTNTATKFSEISRKDPFANTWLLTGITGPDFVDRGGVNNLGDGIIDENDWGYWVKFNYGRHSNSYEWRIPYSGLKVDSENTSQSYSKGKKQLYYLNSIETRSHVALFVKDQRDDSRSTNSISSLKISQIHLVSRGTYKALRAQYNLPDLSNSITYTLKNSDITTQAKDFLKINIEKTIKFTQDYSLAKKTPSSVNYNVPSAYGSSGKLTLNRVSVLGKNEIPVMPDYVFEYRNNPDYDVNKWDGWGFYNGAASPNYLSHTASPNNSDGLAWSLSKVLTPLGSELVIDYERDSYFSICGTPIVKSSSVYQDYPNVVKYTPFNYLDVKSMVPGFVIGDIVRVSGSYTYPCSGVGSTDGTFDYTTSISGISGNRISFTNPLFSFGSCPNQMLINVQVSASVEKVNGSKSGGDIRVSQLTLKDGGLTKCTRYIYTQPDVAGIDITTGVVTHEPDFIKLTGQPYPTNSDVPGYPMTPVVYGQVSVLSGVLLSVSDYDSKVVYEFETPHESMLQISTQILDDMTEVRKFWVDPNRPEDEEAIFTPYWKYDYLSRVHNKISDYTSKIGKIKSIKVYDRTVSLVQPVSETINSYSTTISSNQGQNQGVFSEGTLMFDVIKKKYSTVHKVNRTTVLKYPYVTSYITTTKDGMTTKSENKVWDFITGKVLETVETSPRGFITRSLVKPAYKESAFQSMGSKAIDINNKNMLTQEAARYLYRADAAGNPMHLISGRATTWSSSWSNYRVYNSTSGKFEDKVEGPGVWRKSSSYVWQGDISRQRPDGLQTFSKLNEFNFTSVGQNPGWQALGESKRYNHSSVPIEGKNYYNIHSTIVTGYNNSIIIAEASNAEFGEVTFSSAEDLPAGGLHFGGEVMLGNGTVKYKSKGNLSTKEPHTGDAIVELSSTIQRSFIYSTNNLKVGEKYKVNVWTNSLNGRIFKKVNGGTEEFSAAPTAERKIGDWYLLEYPMTVAAGTTSVEIGVSTTGGTVWFDDFRLQPLDASMTCYVYNGLDYTYPIGSTSLKRFDYVLGNDNTFMKFEYNERDQLVRTFNESFSPRGVHLVSESKTNFKRSHTNQ